MLHAYEMEQAHGVIVDADGDGVPDLIQQEQKSGTGGGLHALLAPCYSVDGGLAAQGFKGPCVVRPTAAEEDAGEMRSAKRAKK